MEKDILIPADGHGKLSFPTHQIQAALFLLRIHPGKGAEADDIRHAASPAAHGKKLRQIFPAVRCSRAAYKEIAAYGFLSSQGTGVKSPHIPLPYIHRKFIYSGISHGANSHCRTRSRRDAPPGAPAGFDQIFPRLQGLLDRETTPPAWREWRYCAPGAWAYCLIPPWASPLLTQ